MLLVVLKSEHLNPDGLCFHGRLPGLSLPLSLLLVCVSYQFLTDSRLELCDLSVVVEDQVDHCFQIVKDPFIELSDDYVFFVPALVPLLVNYLALVSRLLLVDVVNDFVVRCK